MPVTREELENALDMTIQDYCSDDDDIKVHELDDIKKRFIQLIDVSLMPAANEKELDDD